MLRMKGFLGFRMKWLFIFGIPIFKENAWICWLNTAVTWTTPTATTHRPPSLKATLNMVSFYWLYFFSACIFRCICFCERCCCSTSFQVAKYCTKTHFTVFRHSLKCGYFNSKHARAGSFTYIGLGHEFKVGQNDN